MPTFTKPEFEVISDPTCMSALSFFIETEQDEAQLEECVNHVEEKLRDAGYEVKERIVTIRLIHVTLPQLEDADVVEFDQKNEVVECPNASEFEVWLDSHDQLANTI